MLYINGNKVGSIYYNGQKIAKAYRNGSEVYSSAPPTVNFTITPTPSNATVKINGVTTSSVDVLVGTSVSWEVSASGYFSKSGTAVVNENTNMSVSLENRTTTFAVSSLTHKQGVSKSYSNAATHYYAVPYTFTKGKSYTFKFTANTKSAYGALICLTNSTSTNSSTATTYYVPSTKLQTVFNSSTAINEGVTKTVNFGCSTSGATYICITCIGGTLKGNILITNNS